MFNPNQLSIVVRTINDRKNKLKKCLASIAHSIYDLNKIEVIVVYQGDSKTYFEEIQTLVYEYPQIGTFHFIHNPAQQDERAKNTNLGIDKASGQYLAFLDDDDEVLPKHYSSLIEEMQQNSSVWGYSNTILKVLDSTTNKYVEVPNAFYHESFQYLKLVQGNYIPFHSFLIDRIKLDANKVILRTDERLCHFEDYYLLLQLGYYYKPTYLKDFSVVYYRHEANTGVHEASEQKSNQKFLQSKEIIDELKQKLGINHYWTHEIEEYKNSFCSKRIPFTNKLLLYKLTSFGHS